MRTRKLLAVSVALGVAALLAQMSAFQAYGRTVSPTIVFAAGSAASTSSTAVVNLGAT